MLLIADWNEFLNILNQRFKQELSETDFDDEELEELKLQDWLGRKAAAEEQIRSTEKRLRRKLPPSYKNFLEASNGWRYLGTVIRNLLPVERIEWFSVNHQDWIDAYVQPMEEDLGSIESWKQPSVPYEKYYKYGLGQGTCRVEYLPSTLKISRIESSAVVLLNPKVINQYGEWEIWKLSNWPSGAIRYRSFAEYMIDVYYKIGSYKHKKLL